MPYPIGFNPNTPGGKLNKTFGVWDLTNPNAFLEQLAQLKSESPVSSMPRKKPQPQAAVMQPPATPPTTPTTPASKATTPQTPATPTTPASTTPNVPASTVPHTNPPVYPGQTGVAKTMWEDQASAARQRFAADPLAANANNNLRRELGRIAAEESFARRDAESRARYRQANLDRANAHTTQYHPPVKPDQLDKLPMGTAPAMDPWMTGAAPKPVPNQVVVTPDVPKLVESTPTGKLSSIAAPATGVGSGVTGQPIEPVSRPLTPDPKVQEEMMRKAIAARNEQMAFQGQSGVTLPTMDPVALAASKAVSDRYRAMGVNPQDPDVWAKYSADVDAEIAKNRLTMGAGAQEIGAPLRLTDNGRQTGLGALGQTLGSLVGPEIPQDLRQRQINTATTTSDLDAALLGQHLDTSRQAVLDALVAGQMGARQSSGGTSGLAGPSITDRRNELGATVDHTRLPESSRDWRTSTMRPNSAGQAELQQHMIENPDAGKGIGEIGRAHV